MNIRKGIHLPLHYTEWKENSAATGSIANVHTDPQASFIPENNSNLPEFGFYRHKGDYMTTVLAIPSNAQSSGITQTRMLPIYLRSAVTPSVTYLTAKRAFDILLSCTMMIILFVPLLIVMILIKLTDGGPIFFRQKRVGLYGKEFYFYKFRSMVINAEALKQQILANNQHGKNSITFKMKRDPRVTWIGRIIRKTSIDELPQLWNILHGDMSIVGPRPAVPAEVKKYNPHEQRRLNVVPGLTCIWQVSGRADLDFQQQVELDLRYIRDRNFWLDMKLIVLTVPAVLSGKGAY